MNQHFWYCQETIPRYSLSHLQCHFQKLKAKAQGQSSYASFARFQWNQTYELWPWALVSSFSNDTASGIGCKSNNWIDVVIQPVPGKMRLKMVVEMEVEMLDGHHRSLFKEIIWKEPSSFTIQNFAFHSDSSLWEWPNWEQERKMLQSIVIRKGSAEEDKVKKHI